MNLKKISIKISICLLLVLGTLIPSESSYASSVHRTGLKTLHEKIPGIETLYNTTNATLPSVIDLSNKFPEVSDQGTLASCVAFAIGYADKTYQEEIEWGWNLDTDKHLFSPSYIYSQIHDSNTADGGGSSFSDAFNILEKQGCTTLADMPYNGSDYGWKTQPTNKQKKNAAKYKAKKWSKLVDGDYTAIKSQIASGNPVVIGIPVYPDFDSLDASNPIYDNTDGTSRGSHAVCVVGYDDSKKAVKIINSWGTSWGIDGYGWISYDLIENQGISAYVMTDAN